MNLHILLLFFNAFFAVLLASLIVWRILRKEYNPLIEKLKEKADKNDPAE